MWCVVQVSSFGSGVTNEETEAKKNPVKIKPHKNHRRKGIPVKKATEGGLVVNVVNVVGAAAAANPSSASSSTAGAAVLLLPRARKASTPSSPVVNV